MTPPRPVSEHSIQAEPRQKAFLLRHKSQLTRRRTQNQWGDGDDVLAESDEHP